MHNLVFLRPTVTGAKITQFGASFDRRRRVGLRSALQRRI